MKPSRARQIGLMSAIAALANGCSLNRCSFEARSVSVAGNASSALGTVTIESLTYSENRPPQSNVEGLSYVVRGQDFTSEYTQVLIQDASAPGVPVIVLLNSRASGPFVLETSQTVAAADRDRVFDLLSSGRAQVVVTFADSRTLVISTPVIARFDWHRPEC